MREIYSSTDHHLAGRLFDALNASGLPAAIDDEDGKSVVWIRDDDHRTQAKEVLTRFLANPDAAEFVEAQAKVRQIQEIEIRRVAENKRRMIDLRDRWNGVWYRTYPATVVMIGICLLVAAVTTTFQGQGGLDFGLCNNDESAFRNALFIQKPAITVSFAGFTLQFNHKPDIVGTLKSGEVWRFVTPIFLHFSVLHILFNMSMFRDLGFAIEFVRGTRRFVVLVLIIAVISNITQLLWSGPGFGGMSGVVYGMVGYLWMKGKCQPEMGLGLSPNQLVWSVLFLLLCIGGALGPVANAAHVAGFATGIVLGYRHTLIRRLKRLLQPTAPANSDDLNP